MVVDQSADLAKQVENVVEGGGISFEDNQLKLGGYFIVGADLTLGIK